MELRLGLCRGCPRPHQYQYLLPGTCQSPHAIACILGAPRARVRAVAEKGGRARDQSRRTCVERGVELSGSGWDCSNAS